MNTLCLLGLAAVAASGCTAILGDDYTLSSTKASSGTGGGGAAGAGGAGGAPGGAPLWSKSFGDGADQQIWEIAADGAGGVVLAGIFLGTVDFGGGPLGAKSGMDIFVARFDGQGNHLWSKAFGADGDQLLTGLAVDSAGNIVLCGGFSGQVSFGGETLVSAGAVDAGGADAFVAKLDGQGGHLWSRRYGDALAQSALDVGIGPGDGIVVAGVYVGAMDFGAGPVAAGGPWDVFAVRLGTDGSPVWSQHFPGQDDPFKFATVAVRGKKDLLLGGSFRPRLELGKFVLESANGKDLDGYLASLDWATGEVLSARQFSGPGRQGVRTVRSDGTAGALVTGVFEQSIDFGAGPAESAGGLDGFVARYEADGALAWGTRFGGKGDDQGCRLAVGAGGDVALAGAFGGTMDLGGGPLQGVDAPDLFVAKLDAKGGHRWSRAFGGELEQFEPRLALDAEGNVFVAATFRGNIQVGAATLTSAGNNDVWLAKLGP